MVKIVLETNCIEWATATVNSIFGTLELAGLKTVPVLTAAVLLRPPLWKIMCRYLLRAGFNRD